MKWLLLNRVRGATLNHEPGTVHDAQSLNPIRSAGGVLIPVVGGIALLVNLATTLRRRGEPWTLIALQMLTASWAFTAGPCCRVCKVALTLADPGGVALVSQDGSWDPDSLALDSHVTNGDGSTVSVFRISLTEEQKLSEASSRFTPGVEKQGAGGISLGIVTVRHISNTEKEFTVFMTPTSTDPHVSLTLSSAALV